MSTFKKHWEEAKEYAPGFRMDGNVILCKDDNIKQTTYLKYDSDDLDDINRCNYYGFIKTIRDGFYIIVNTFILIRDNVYVDIDIKYIKLFQVEKIKWKSETDKEQCVYNLYRWDMKNGFHNDCLEFAEIMTIYNALYNIQHNLRLPVDSNIKRIIRFFKENFYEDKEFKGVIHPLHAGDDEYYEEKYAIGITNEQNIKLSKSYKKSSVKNIYKVGNSFIYVNPDVKSTSFYHVGYIFIKDGRKNITIEANAFYKYDKLIGPEIKVYNDLRSFGWFQFDEVTKGESMIASPYSDKIVFENYEFNKRLN